MPFDPAWPQNGQNIDADRFRGQFAGLIDLINQASSITSVVVDAVNTLPPGTPATVSVNVVGTVLHFTFGVPAGVPGTPGDTGAPGQPFAQAVVDSVTTLPAGSSATVSVSFDGTNVHFDFGLPQGLPGQDGEVLASQLAAEIMTTSSNTNAVGTLDSPFGDPDMEALRQKMNELILALRR